MNPPSRALAKQRLAVLLARVLQDGIITDDERVEMRQFYRDEMLNVSDVKEVFTAYMKSLQADVLADGVITREEAERCKNAVDQLKIPLILLPPTILDIVTGKIKPAP